MTTHYIITYYLKIEDKWNRMVYVCESMYMMIKFLEAIAKDDYERLVSVETA